jgi:hypothetical protein
MWKALTSTAVRASNAVSGAARVLWRARSYAAATLVVVVSCGDAGPAGKTASVAEAVCSSPPNFPAPCWLTIDPGTGCTSYPDFVGCATPFDASNPQPFKVQTRFLWSGTYPLQIVGAAQAACFGGTCPSGQYCGAQNICYTDKLSSDRVSVLTGVAKANGAPVAGVTVSVVTDAQYGSVLSEWGHFPPATMPLPAPTGRYFLAVNGGSPIRLAFTKPGYLRAERTVMPVVGQYTQVSPVDLVPEPTGSLIAPGSGVWQVASGAIETDTWGTRKARIFIPPSTTWTPATSSCTGTAPACSTHGTSGGSVRFSV